MKAKPPFSSALSVQAGIEPPETVNPYLNRKKRPRKPLLSAEAYMAGILKGDRVMLSQAITLIESANPAHFELAQKVIEEALPYSGNAIRIGITGVPGVGKSTFIDCLGKYVTSLGHRLAVLAIDPSSERSKGSILGDKTRMEELSQDPNAYIRPSPSSATLGGVARKTRETVILCEAAGFNVIFIETVGVGQSETAVKSMTDFFLLLMLAGAGDELQGIKRGIMEMVDAILITKADGDNVPKANSAKAQYSSALKLFPHHDAGWQVPVATCSVLEKQGIDAVWGIITSYEKQLKASGWFAQMRTNQQIATFYEWIEHTIKQRFFSQKWVETQIQQLIPLIETKKISPYKAANLLINNNLQK
ncbi:MAG: methylmalonyl Co-A mutase-associated GTPase MeaB [Bacteroidales bacterium]|jgi:LAO/AO transport system kinase|nr:methylmalonyl Co-A mutase-associated GTPase MeaB [Bacteroidales bacterium]